MTDTPPYPAGERWTPIYARMFSPDHELAGDPVCRRWAFTDLCNMARFEDGNRIISGTLVPLKRGELVASLRFLAQRWSWSTKKVRQFIALLTDPSVGKLGTVRETPQGTVYRVVKYDTYANPGHSKGHSKSYDKGTGRAQVGHKVQQGVTGSNRERVSAPAPADELSNWLGEHAGEVADCRLADDDVVRRTLYQHYGPPCMRASAWKLDTGASVPTAERPRLLAVALTGYALEGKRRIVANEFDGMLRQIARRELAGPKSRRRSGPLFDLTDDDSPAVA